MCFLTNQRVLLIEDEALIALSTEDYLRDMGAAHICVVASKAQAMLALDNFRPSIAIVDIALPDGDDYDVADRLAADGVPFVFSSGHFFEEVPHRHAERVHCNKPCSEEEMTRALRALMPPTGTSPDQRAPATLLM